MSVFVILHPNLMPDSDELAKAVVLTHEEWEAIRAAASQLHMPFATIPNTDVPFLSPKYYEGLAKACERLGELAKPLWCLSNYGGSKVPIIVTPVNPDTNPDIVSG